MRPWCQAEAETVALVPPVLPEFPVYSSYLVADVTPPDVHVSPAKCVRDLTSRGNAAVHGATL